jgi:hypothetical protein
MPTYGGKRSNYVVAVICCPLASSWQPLLARIHEAVFEMRISTVQTDFLMFRSASCLTTDSIAGFAGRKSRKAGNVVISGRNCVFRHM